MLAALLLAPLCAAAEGELRWVGCAISRDAYADDLVKAFEARTGNRVSIAAESASEGIRDVASLRADIGGSCRFTLENEPREAAAVLKPVAWDALVVIVHRDNPVEGIDFAQLQGVLAGGIRNWRELGGPNRRLDLYARLDKTSGVGHTLRKLLFADYAQEFKAARFFETSGALEQAVADNAGALGVTGISSARDREVKILALSGQAPSFDSIKAGTYPLYYPLYLVTNPANPNAALVDQFVQFAYSPEGMAIIRRNGVVPYNDALHLVMKEREQEERARSRGQQ